VVTTVVLTYYVVINIWLVTVYTFYGLRMIVEIVIYDNIRGQNLFGFLIGQTIANLSVFCFDILQFRNGVGDLIIKRAMARQNYQSLVQRSNKSRPDFRIMYTPIAFRTTRYNSTRATSRNCRTSIAI